MLATKVDQLKQELFNIKSVLDGPVYLAYSLQNAMWMTSYSITKNYVHNFKEEFES